MNSPNFGQSHISNNFNNNQILFDKNDIISPKLNNNFISPREGMDSKRQCVNVTNKTDNTHLDNMGSEILNKEDKRKNPHIESCIGG